MTIKASTLAWLLLLALTAFSVGIADIADTRLAGAAVLVPVLLATLLKGHIVIDAFMGLRRAPLLWRGVVIGWLLAVVGLVAFAFRISQI